MLEDWYGVVATHSLNHWRSLSSTRAWAQTAELLYSVAVCCCDFDGGGVVGSSFPLLRAGALRRNELEAG